MLAVGPDESLGKEAGADSLGIFTDTLAKPVRSGSFRIDRCDDSLFALAVNDRFGNILALLLSFEPIAVGAVAEVLPLNPEIGGEGPVATLPVLNRYHGVSKCEVNIVLNKGV